MDRNLKNYSYEASRLLSISFYRNKSFCITNNIGIGSFGDPNAGEYNWVGQSNRIPSFDINRDLVKNGKMDEIKLTLGHEFFHFIQDIYY